MVGIIEILRLIYISVTFIPCILFFIYGIIILFYSKNTSQFYSGNTYVPYVTVVIPTHNEEDIISKKIENIISSDYPLEKLELFFVDDSTDSTSRIIEGYQEKYSLIRLMKSKERMGYSPSMLAGSHAANGEIIVLTDAHSFFDENTIKNLIRNFENPSVGAVTGTSSILNPEDEIAKSENLYLKFYDRMRTAETNLDSTFWFKGEAAAVRKSLIDDLEECNATFDTTVALYVKQKGYRSIFDPDVRFYEYAPGTHADRIKQKTIRAANIMKILFYFKSFIFNSKYGKFGSIVYPMNFFMVVITPLLVFLNLLLLVTLFIFDVSFAVSVLTIYIGLSFILFVFFRSFLITFVEFTYSLLKAIYQILFTGIEHDKVEKVMSTRKAP